MAWAGAGVVGVEVGVELEGAYLVGMSSSCYLEEEVVGGARDTPPFLRCPHTIIIIIILIVLIRGILFRLPLVPRLGNMLLKLLSGDVFLHQPLLLCV